jgi:arsenate reductase (thioredoxin)
MRPPADTDYEGIVDDLAYRYSDSFSRADIAAEVAEVRAGLEPNSRHPEYLGMLVTKQVRDRLAAKARQTGQAFRSVPTILYVCVHNSARSQFAAALTEQLAGDHVHVRAAGMHPTSDVNPVVVQVLAERGIELKHAFPTGKPWDYEDAADIVVQMGAVLPSLPGRRTVSWEIEDPANSRIVEVRRICNEIEARVRGLLADLQVPVNGAG